MAKKILAICAALVALAVVPAAASASPLLTDEGVALGAGATITGTSTGELKFTSSLGTVTCTKSHLHGNVVTNSGKVIEGTVSSATFTNNAGGKCSSWVGAESVQVTTSFERPAGTKVGTPWCVLSQAEDKFKIRGGSCSEAEKPLQFKLDFPGFTCVFEKSGGITGTFTTNVTPVPLTSTSAVFTMVEGGGLCPSSGTLDPLTYDLETTNGVGLTIS